MDARLLPPSAKRRGSWGAHPWTLVVLGLFLAALTQACSDNNGTVGPTFTATPVPVVGDAIGGPAGTLFVQVTVNPSTVDIGRRASVLVIATNTNGFAVSGRPVQLTATGGNLDATSGVTDANGLFATTMVVPCGTLVGEGSVTAIVQGAVSPPAAFTAVTPATNDPCV
jgi:hypothetical protein